MPGPTSSPRPYIRVCALLLALGASACRSTELPGEGAVQSISSPSASPSVETKPVSDPRPVAAATVFRPLRGYRFMSAAPQIRKRARAAFGKLIGRNLFGVAVRRVERRAPEQRRTHRTRHKRKGRRHRRPPRASPEAVLIAISVDVPPGGTQKGFQRSAVEALSQDTSSVLIHLGGYEAHFSKNATPRHQSRVFFFLKGTVLMQVFGPHKLARAVATSLLKRDGEDG